MFEDLPTIKMFLIFAGIVLVLAMYAIIRELREENNNLKKNAGALAKKDEEIAKRDRNVHTLAVRCAELAAVNSRLQIAANEVRSSKIIPPERLN